MSDQPVRPYAAAPLSDLADTIWGGLETELVAAPDPLRLEVLVAALSELVWRVDGMPGEEDKLRTDLMEALELLGGASERLVNLGASDLADQMVAYLDRVAPTLPVMRVVGYERVDSPERAQE